MNKKEKTPLNSTLMKELLLELGTRLQDLDKKVDIGVYGGAVICMEYELRQTSFDIDCVYTDMIIDKLVADIAKKYNIQSDWMNSAVRDIVFDDMKYQEMVKTVQYGGLCISLPSIEQMLAMKLYAARLRTSSDFDDAYSLCKLMGITTGTELRAILTKFFKHESIRLRNKTDGNTIGRFINKLSEALR